MASIENPASQTSGATDYMKKIRAFTVVPALPEPIQPLRDLAYNLWWCWNSDAFDLFRRLDMDLWEEVYHNPVRLLGAVKQARLEQVANDESYLAQMNRVLATYYAYRNAETWCEQNVADLKGHTIAYFSAEFGLHECLPIYSGGLGILAGDHLKSASDLGLPLVAVGLLYRQGYFRQRLTHDGWQQEEYPNYDFYQMPVIFERDQNGQPRRFSLNIMGRPVAVQIWRIQVGRVPLYLLDTDLPENHHDDRKITAQLYGGDRTNRIHQEILLGIGGVCALEMMGIKPSVYHMNEGHSAFLGIERVRMLMSQDKLSFDEAIQSVKASTVFTTHTPVPAGIDTFPPALVSEKLGGYLRSAGIDLKQFLRLGQDGPHSPFSMAVLALSLSSSANGVSKMHGGISRKMWSNIFPGVPVDEVPIGHVTNGIHTRTWLSLDMAQLFERYLGPRWHANPLNHEIWNRVDDIPDAELWRTHERRRERLVVIARKRLSAQLRRAGAAPSQIRAADEVFDPGALTIGFARRFAPYKRGTLLLRDPDRLIKILTNHDRPVQIVFAGKAHPHDDKGKELIKQIVDFSRRPEVRRHMVMLEDYDMNLARYMVSGVDIWLNTPLIPFEASGTSGMKVLANGGINLSVLDGWWPEAYDGENGWAVGDGTVYADRDYQDWVESQALYELLEKELAPMYYDRGPDGLPRRWIEKMKMSMKTCCPVFNTNRMVADYTRKYYVPTAKSSARVSADEHAVARRLAAWNSDIGGKWQQVAIEHVEADAQDEIRVGAELEVRARIRLGEIPTENVYVEIYHGPRGVNGELVETHVETMACTEQLGDGRFAFTGTMKCELSGQHGFAVRVRPHHDDEITRFQTGLIVWG